MGAGGKERGKIIKIETAQITGICMKTFVQIPEKGNFVISSVKLPLMVSKMDAALFGNPHKGKRFETAIFCADEDLNVDYGDIVFIKQFKTWQEAVACHKKLRQTVESKNEFF